MPHDPTTSHGIYALWTTDRRGITTVQLNFATASRLLLQSPVDNAPAPEAPAVRAVDTFVADLIGESTEPNQVLPGQEGQQSALAAVVPGELRLAAEVITLAWETAHLPFDCEDRRDARAWLQDASKLYSARVCFEALGKDYDVVRVLLAKRWLKVDGAQP